MKTHKRKNDARDAPLFKKTRGLLSAAAVLLVFCLVLTAPVGATDTHTHISQYAAEYTPTDGDYCLICDIAAKINALPNADEITVENAAAVIDQIHAIDRIKFDISSDEEYDELLSLVESENYSPKRYVDAVSKIKSLNEGDGMRVFISKMFLSDDGQAVNVEKAEVLFKISNTDDSFTQELTLSAMPDVANSLCADMDFYSSNPAGNGWTYTYVLPAGTYTITEISDSGAMVGDEEFVTTSTTWKVGENGEEVSGRTATFTVSENNDAVLVLFTNVVASQYTVYAFDGSTEITEDFEFSIALREDGETVTPTDNGYSLPGGREYTLTISKVPTGYIIPESFTFTSGETQSDSSSECYRHISNGDNKYLIAVALSKSQSTVTFHNETNTQEASITHGDTSFTGTIIAPSKTGYTFLGWNTTAGIMVVDATGNLVDTVDGYTTNGQWTNTSSSVDLYAAWKEHTYTVTFDANGGSGSVPARTVMYTEDVVLPSADSFTRDGWTFLGWAELPAAAEAKYCSGDIVNQLTAEDGATVTLYAVWKKNSAIADDPEQDNQNPIIPGGSAEPMPDISSGSATDTGSGNYSEYPRSTENGGEVGFGTSPVVIKVILPEGTTGSVTLLTKPDTPDTGDNDVYYDFELDIPNYPEGEGGQVIWRIPQSILDDEFGADDYGVSVFDGDEWKPIASVWEEVGNYLHYTTEIAGDGNFIIVKEKGISEKAETDAPVVVPGDEPQDTPDEVLPPSSGDDKPDEKEEEQKIPVLGLGIGLLILILIIAGIVFAVRRRK